MSCFAGCSAAWSAFVCAAIASLQAAELEAVASMRVLPELVDLRHRIHQHPELSNRERETAALVAKHLRALDLDVRTGIAHHGVVALVRGARPGPIVAVRADMDALPVTEQTDLPFKSTVRARISTARRSASRTPAATTFTRSSASASASVLAGMRDQLAGTVMLIFQPAEEGPPAGEEGGATMMLAEGLFAETRPEAIFALHASPLLPIGQVGFTPGPAFASSDKFSVTAAREAVSRRLSAPGRRYGRARGAGDPRAADDPLALGRPDRAGRRQRRHRARRRALQHHSGGRVPRGDRARLRPRRAGHRRGAHARDTRRAHQRGRGHLRTRAMRGRIPTSTTTHRSRAGRARASRARSARRRSSTCRARWARRTSPGSRRRSPASTSGSASSSRARPPADCTRRLPRRRRRHRGRCRGDHRPRARLPE